MFLLVSPLKSQIQRWPFATLIIVLVMLGFSVFQFPQIAAFQAFAESAEEQSGVSKARLEMLQHFCAESFLDQQCKFLMTLTPQNFKTLHTTFQSYRKKFPDDSGEKFLAWKRWVSNEDVEKGFEAGAKNHPTVIAYKKARTKQRSLVTVEAKKQYVLVRGNTHWISLGKSLFVHNTWVDLALSISLLLLFGTFLEQRVRATGLLPIFLLGGMGANFLHASFIPFGTSLQGAAGGLSAVLGAFLIYFYQEKSYVMRRISIPSWLLAVTVLLVNTAVCWLIGSEATHLVHGVGFALGAIIASMQKDLFPLKSTVLFPHEQAMYYSAKKASRFEAKMELFQKIYQLNPQSFYVYRSLFSYFEKHRLSLNAFKAEHKTLVTEILQECFLCPRKSEKYHFSQQVLGLVPLSWNLNILKLKVDANHIIDCANAFQAKGYLAQSLRYYDYFLEKYAAHPRAEQAHAVIMQVFDELERFDPEFRLEMLEVLTNYAKAHPTTHFHSQIRRISQQVQKERGSDAA